MVSVASPAPRFSGMYILRVYDKKAKPVRFWENDRLFTSRYKQLKTRSDSTPPDTTKDLTCWNLKLLQTIISFFSQEKLGMTSFRLFQPSGFAPDIQDGNSVFIVTNDNYGDHLDQLDQVVKNQKNHIAAQLFQYNLNQLYPTDTDKRIPTERIEASRYIGMALEKLKSPNVFPRKLADSFIYTSYTDQWGKDKKDKDRQPFFTLKTTLTKGLTGKQLSPLEPVKSDEPFVS